MTKDELERRQRSLGHKLTAELRYWSVRKPKTPQGSDRGSNTRSFDRTHPPIVDSMMAAPVYPRGVGGRGRGWSIRHNGPSPRLTR